jgi:hypothetical protein
MLVICISTIEIQFLFHFFEKSTCILFGYALFKTLKLQQLAM